LISSAQREQNAALRDVRLRPETRKLAVNCSSWVNFTVHLDSVAGMVVEAIDIGNTIRIFKFNTFVADGAICASACGLIWLAGDRRYLGANAALGFHTVYDPRTRQPTPTGLALGLMASRGAGASASASPEES